MRISSTWLAWLGLAGSLGGAAPARAALGPDEVVIGDWADRSVRIVSCADGRTIARVPGLECFTRHVAVSPDAETVAVIADEAVTLVDLTTADTPVVSESWSPGYETRSGGAWTPDGRALVSVNPLDRAWLRVSPSLSLVGRLPPLGGGNGKPDALRDGSGVLIGGQGLVGLDETWSLPAESPLWTRQLVVGQVSGGGDRTFAVASSPDARLALAVIWEGTREPSTGRGVLIGLPEFEIRATIPLAPCHPTAAVFAPDLDAAFILDAGDIRGVHARIIELGPLDASMRVLRVLDLGGTGTGTAEPNLVRLADGRLVTTLRDSGRLVVVDADTLTIEASFDIGGSPSTLGAAPAPRRWTVLRGASPDDLATTRSDATLSPHADDAEPMPARLGDGAALYYDVSERYGPEVLLRVDKMPSRNTVRLTWRDFDRSTDPTVDASRSALHADGRCVGLGGGTSSVSAALVDENGDPAGIVEGIEARPASTAPARVAHPWRSLPDGTRLALASDVATEVLPEVAIGGVVVAARTPARFSADAPTIEVHVPPEIPAGDNFWAFAIVEGGVLPYACSWDFDGNGSIDAVGEEVLWSYAEAGTYRVTFDMTDAAGCSNRSERVVEVR